MKHYIYILKCADGSYYTGYTTNVENRVKAHNEGRGAKYTKGRGPVSLVHKEAFETKSEAMKREWDIKHKMTREEKEALIKGEI